MTTLSVLQKISLRSLAAHRLRFLLTLLAVVLGTTFVAGGFILTASLSTPWACTSRSSPCWAAATCSSAA